MSGSLPLPLPPTPPAGGPPPITAPANVTSVRSPTDGTPQNGAQLWMRKWKLTVGTPSGQNALDLSLLDFEFDIEMQEMVPPWIGRIKVWNPGDQVTGVLASKQMTKVSLFAGYQAPSTQYGSLFQGQINYFKIGRQTTDTYIEIFATTMDPALNAAIVNTWLPAGWGDNDAIQALVTAMAPFGISLGQITDLGNKTSPRGRLLYGMARDYLRDIARTHDAQFFTDLDGKLHLLKEGDILKMGNQTVPVLNGRTGLIDVATRTMDGAVEVKCLLNPSIRPGMQIHIDNASVAEIKTVDTTNLVADAFRLSMGSYINKADGYYPVGSVRHQGQNRGNPWYSQIVSRKAVPDVGLKTSAQ